MGEEHWIAQSRQHRHDAEANLAGARCQGRQCGQAIAARFVQDRDAVAEPDMIEVQFLGFGSFSPEMRKTLRHIFPTDQLAGV